MARSQNSARCIVLRVIWIFARVTYEFNDQREQVWIAQDDEVMRQNTDLLWKARGGNKLTKPERALIKELESARMGGKAFGKSVRKWQDVETKGGEQLRKELGLDKKRPIVLLATNVLGDSFNVGKKRLCSKHGGMDRENYQILRSR